MKRYPILISFVAVLAGFGGSAALAQEGRPTLAIADIAVTPGGWTLPPPQLGATIIDLLVGELVSSQRFHVYDGQWLVPESEAGGHVNLTRLREAAASRHVDYLVLGSVTAFSTAQSRSRTGGVLPKPFMAGAFSRQQMQMAVGMTFRIVDVNTGEVVTTATAEGIAKRHSTGFGLLGLLGIGHPGLLPIAVAHSASANHARDAMLDEAVRQAVHDAARALAIGAPRVESR
jgi:curli biogenesis system outer membrane secretion channel CsgG